MKRYYLYFGKKFTGKVFIILFSSWLPLTLVAQEQKSVLGMAEEAYGRQEYATAAALYERVAKVNTKRAKTEHLLKLADCYKQIGLFSQAANWYANITALPDCPADAMFAYGETLRNLERYEEAKQQYNRFSSTAADSLQLKELAIRGCDSAINWKRRPVEVTLNPIKELNTENSEIITGVVKDGLLLISNGYRKMQINGTRESHPVDDKRTLQPYYKPYIFKQYSVGDSNVLLEELFPQLLGKFKYHIGPLCMNGKRDTLYVTINEQNKALPGNNKGTVNGTRRLYIYQAVKVKEYWTTPTLLANINQEGYSSSYPVLAENGNLLYFVSDRPGGQGHADIWYSEKQPDGTWGAPLNAGAVLNTVGDEAFPTINEDGALYFSSKGHPGMGGYDVFRAEGNRAAWKEPLNLGTPFNTGGDDIGLILKRNGYEGFLSSNRQNGSGADDIYAFKDAHFFERFNTSSGSLQESGNGKNGGGAKDGSEYTHNGKTTIGKKSLTLEEEKDKAELEKLQFFYNFNSTELETESRRILDYVAGIMQKHPGWKLVVISYTDSRGANDYNKDLSTMRCYSVINYLDDKGIAPKRLYYRNLAKEAITNGCTDGVNCTEKQHQQNRRSELKVLY